jgi:hypothetical protein
MPGALSKALLTCGSLAHVGITALLCAFLERTELRSRPMGKRRDTLVFIPAWNELITAEVSRRRRK